MRNGGIILESGPHMNTAFSWSQVIFTFNNEFFVEAGDVVTLDVYQYQNTWEFGAFLKAKGVGLTLENQQKQVY